MHGPKDCEVASWKQPSLWTDKISDISHLLLNTFVDQIIIWKEIDTVVDHLPMYGNQELGFAMVVKNPTKQNG